MNALQAPVQANSYQQDGAEARGLRILLVHSNPLLCLGIRSVLQRHGMQVVGSTVEREEILALVDATKPDMVILDATLTCRHDYGEDRAAEMIAQMRQAGVRGIFVLAPVVDEESLFQFLMVGASAYERDRLSVEAFVQKVRLVAEGSYLFSEEGLADERATTIVRCEVFQLPAEPEQEDVEELPDSTLLTEREIEILKFVMVGLSNKQIAKIAKVTLSPWLKPRGFPHSTIVGILSRCPVGTAR